MLNSRSETAELIRRLSDITQSLKVPSPAKQGKSTDQRRQTVDGSSAFHSLNPKSQPHFTSQFFRQLELNTPVRFLPIVTRIRARHERKWVKLEERYGVGNLLIYLQSQTGISMLTWGLILVAGVTISLDFLFLHYAPIFSYLVGLVYPITKTQEILLPQGKRNSVSSQSSLLLDGKSIKSLGSSGSFNNTSIDTAMMDGGLMGINMIVGEMRFWLKYWSIFASVQFLDHHLPKRLRERVPLLPVIKTVFYIWLCHPGTRGANVIYSMLMSTTTTNNNTDEEVYIQGKGADTESINAQDAKTNNDQNDFQITSFGF